MATRYSKTLKKLAESDPRISEYEYDEGNDYGEHWLHLVWPYTTHDGGSVHEYTVKDCIEGMKSVYKNEAGVR